MNKITKSKKTAKPIMHLEESAKFRSWHEALEQAEFINATDDDEWRKRLINLMFKWADRNDALEMQQFCWEYKIPIQTFYDWNAKYADIAKAIVTVKNQIGARRRYGTMNFKLHYQSAYRDMHCLAYKWAEEVDDYHANLKAKSDAEQNSGKTVVVLDRYVE